MPLSTEKRDALPADDFAVPGKRALPIHDRTHVKLAWDMVDRTEGLTDAERHAARRRILRKARKLGIPTDKWQAADLLAGLELQAMSLQVPQWTGHPNAHPFSGVLTRLDEPSDKPPGGSGGKRVIVPSKVAEEALASLLGMGLDCTKAFDNHDQKNKIGVITAAEVRGKDLWIEGLLYAADFPVEVAFIRANQKDLGFSFELQQVMVASKEADPMTVESLVFTGAAVLFKRAAAYESTSIAAASEEIDMTPEQIAQLVKDSVSAAVTAALQPLQTQLTAAEDKLKKLGTVQGGSVHHLVKPHADKIRACADGMMAAGMGMHEERGHVHLLNKMADKMEADAMMGKMPHIHTDHDFWTAAGAKSGPVVDENHPAIKALSDNFTKQIGTLTAANEKLTGELTTLKATKFQAAGDNAPERKTLSPDLTALLLKKGISMEAGAEKKTLTTGEVDQMLAAAKITGQEAMVAKINLAQAGVLPSPGAH